MLSVCSWESSSFFSIFHHSIHLFSSFFDIFCTSLKRQLMQCLQCQDARKVWDCGWNLRLQPIQNFSRLMQQRIESMLSFFQPWDSTWRLGRTWLPDVILWIAPLKCLEKFHRRLACKPWPCPQTKIRVLGGNPRMATCQQPWPKLPWIARQKFLCLDWESFGHLGLLENEVNKLPWPKHRQMVYRKGCNFDSCTCSPRFSDGIRPEHYWHAMV